jgi:tetrahydromethanopterin:alpha-L-glutamate ligase
MPRLSESIVPGATTSARTIALVTDANDWHARALGKAFAALGMQTRLTKLPSCHFDTGSRNGLYLPDFGAGSPEAVLVRDMAGGTFEAVTLRLGVLHALQEIGIPVWNSARSIERCVDKSATSFLLARAGLPTPMTWATESREAAAEIVRRDAGPFVLKPLFGSQGRGLRLVHKEHDLPAPAEVSGVYYLQRFVGVEREDFRDFRVFVSSGRVVAAMMRRSSHWVTNVKRGGKPVAAVADSTMRDLAIAATTVVGANFAGVDMVCDQDGRLSVLEVNSMPAWSGLQRTTPIDIAATLASDLVASLPMQARRNV